MRYSGLFAISAVVLSFAGMAVGPGQPTALPAAATAPAMPRLSWSSPYDPQNVLARTIRGEIPTVRLYEDEHVLAAMDTLQGHFVVMSKDSRARNFLEIEPEQSARMFAVVQRLASAEIAALGVEGFLVRTNAGSDSGVAQFHIHVYPHRKDDPPAAAQATQAELQAVADRIKAAMR